MRPLIAILLFLCLIPTFQASAQNFSAQDIIAAVNALRASQGLAPYQVDSEVMAFAKEHTQYQASIGQSTHLHSDGNNSLAYGMVENIAGGTATWLTVDIIISKIWADPIHMKTMIGYESGYVGAGVVVSGGDVYVTLNVRPGKSAAVAPGQSTAGAAAPTQVALVPLLTATPGANGSVLHVVGYGQSLWSIAIAYGVKIDEIRTLNGLVPGSTDIYAGQRLVIRPAGSLPTASAAVTSAAPVETEPVLAVVASTQAPTPASTLSPTPQPSPTLHPTPTRKPFAPFNGVPIRRLLAYLLIAVGALGALVYILKGFRS